MLVLSALNPETPEDSPRNSQGISEKHGLLSAVCAAVLFESKQENVPGVGHGHGIACDHVELTVPHLDHGGDADEEQQAEDCNRRVDQVRQLEACCIHHSIVLGTFAKLLGLSCVGYGPGAILLACYLHTANSTFWYC